MHTKRTGKYALCGALAAVLACSQDARPAPGGDEAAKFVQRVYDWYVPRARDSVQGPAWKIFVADSSALLSSELVSALRADLMAQQASRSEIVGLDFDPVLNAQDPCAAYAVGPASKHDSTFIVPVFDVCDGRKAVAPRVLVILTHSGQRWTMSDFSYPNLHPAADLFTVLRRLAALRRK